MQRGRARAGGLPAPSIGDLLREGNEDASIETGLGMMPRNGLKWNAMDQVCCGGVEGTWSPLCWQQVSQALGSGDSNCHRFPEER